MKFKRTKTSRQRGSSSHGWGAKKKHRGAGHRGGRGDAGSGKRGDAKKPSFWKNMRDGKSGFSSKVNNNYKTINISEIETKINTFISKGKAEFKNNIYSIDLSKIKDDKLLGAGKVTKTFEIKAKIASASAIKKVESAGGKVILPKTLDKPIKENKEIVEKTEVKKE